MSRSTRASFLFVAAFLMAVGAAGYMLALVPDLQRDLVEIGVRPRVVGTTMIYLYFAAMAMCGCLAIVVASAIRILGDGVPDRVPLAVVAAVYVAFGGVAFGAARSPHQLGPLVAGLLIGTVVAVSDRAR